MTEQTVATSAAVARTVKKSSKKASTSPRTELFAIEKQLKALEAQKQKVLANIVKMEGNSFRHGPAFYNIRQRNGIFFVCKSEQKFGSWLIKE